MFVFVTLTSSYIIFFFPNFPAVNTLKWGELYGTADNESVSKMMYNAQGIAEAGHYTLVVQNELGKVVSQQSLELGLGQNSQVLSTQQFTPGFYYLTLRNAKGKVVGAQKLIKQ